MFHSGILRLQLIKKKDLNQILIHDGIFEISTIEISICEINTSEISTCEISTSEMSCWHVAGALPRAMLSNPVLLLVDRMISPLPSASHPLLMGVFLTIAAQCPVGSQRGMFPQPGIQYVKVLSNYIYIDIHIYIYVYIYCIYIYRYTYIYRR